MRGERERERESESVWKERMWLELLPPVGGLFEPVKTEKCHLGGSTGPDESHETAPIPPYTYLNTSPQTTTSAH